MVLLIKTKNVIPMAYNLKFVNYLNVVLKNMKK